MRLLDAERSLRSLTLAHDEKLIEGVDAKRQRLYRRLVRGNLFGVVRRAIPITRKLLGEETVDAMIARFLDERGPSTRIVRQVAGKHGGRVTACKAAGGGAELKLELPVAAAR